MDYVSKDYGLSGSLERQRVPQATDSAGDKAGRFIPIAGQTIVREKTLIVFDEVQLCERALTSLKYNGKLIPIEVKSVDNTRVKSLKFYMENYSYMRRFVSESYKNR